MVPIWSCFTLVFEDRSLVEDVLFYGKEYWTGDSRDGRLENGDGYHYYSIAKSGIIQEAFEVYEKDDGEVIISPLPEMNRVNWYKDLGFEDLETLDEVSAEEFQEVKTMQAKQ